MGVRGFSCSTPESRVNGFKVLGIGCWVPVFPQSLAPGPQPRSVQYLIPKGLLASAEERTASPSELGRGAFQNGLRDGDARGNLIFALALERRGRDPQEELQLLRGQMRGVEPKLEDRNSKLGAPSAHCRVSSSHFRFSSFRYCPSLRAAAACAPAAALTRADQARAKLELLQSRQSSVLSFQFVLIIG